MPKSISWSKFAPNNTLYHYRLGYAYHLMRRLAEASNEYKAVLKLDPPRLVLEDDLKLVNKYAPRLFVNPGEFFDLKDLAAVIHPKRPIIAYNLFWEDDIDHPGDNDRRLLKKKKMVIISKWPNAVINQYFLAYNYFPKRQWPNSSSKKTTIRW